MRFCVSFTSRYTLCSLPFAFYPMRYALCPLPKTIGAIETAACDNKNLDRILTFVTIIFDR
jgi:hypothetical protein